MIINYLLHPVILQECQPWQEERKVFQFLAWKKKMNILKNSPASLNIIIHLGRNKNQGYPFIKYVFSVIYLQPLKNLAYL